MSGIDSYTATPEEALRRSLVAAVDPLKVCAAPGEEHWFDDFRFMKLSDGTYGQIDFDGRYARSVLTMGGYELQGAKAALHREPAILVSLAQKHCSIDKNGEAWTVLCSDKQLAAALSELAALGVVISAF